jgi:hypothetical protein
MCASEVREVLTEGRPIVCRSCDSQVLDQEAITNTNDEGIRLREQKKSGQTGEHWWPKLGGLPWPSSKTLVVKLKLLEWLNKDPLVKIVIFTQYLGM